jgi:hypothetical protein
MAECFDKYTPTMRVVYEQEVSAMIEQKFGIGNDTETEQTA